MLTEKDIRGKDIDNNAGVYQICSKCEDITFHRRGYKRIVCTCCGTEFPAVKGKYNYKVNTITMSDLFKPKKKKGLTVNFG